MSTLPRYMTLSGASYNAPTMPGMFIDNMLCCGICNEHNNIHNHSDNKNVNYTDKSNKPIVRCEIVMRIILL